MPAGWFLILLSGWLMTAFGTVPALMVLATLATTGIIAALRLCPTGDPVELAHSHDKLPADHTHLRGQKAGRHRHPVVINDLHPHWPTGHGVICQVARTPPPILQLTGQGDRFPACEPF